MPFVGGPMPGGVEVRYVTCTLNLDEGTLAISVNGIVSHTFPFECSSLLT